MLKLHFDVHLIMHYLGAFVLTSIALCRLFWFPEHPPRYFYDVTVFVVTTLGFFWELRDEVYHRWVKHMYIKKRRVDIQSGSHLFQAGEIVKIKIPSRESGEWFSIAAMIHKTYGDHIFISSTPAILSPDARGFNFWDLFFVYIGALVASICCWGLY